MVWCDGILENYENRMPACLPSHTGPHQAIQSGGAGHILCPAKLGISLLAGTGVQSQLRLDHSLYNEGQF